MPSALIDKTACEIVDLLKTDQVSPLELLDALEERIGEIDETVNALPTLCLDRARTHAKSMSERPMENRGLLAGLPVPIKDLSEVEGVLTTHGSPIFKNNVPRQSDVLVEHLERNGALVYAKSNTPEFGAGANTFNEVFGATRNPWNTSRSAAGSSGGAAVALATGMAWVAHGSDMGGSLRNPASFCGVCGMRPSPGRVATTRATKLDSNLGQEGPMARNVEDLALLFDAMVGEAAADPVSLPHDGASYLNAARSGWKPTRVAFSRDLGITPVDPEVAEIVEMAARRLEEQGVIVEEAHPDLSEAHECFHVLRALAFAVGMKPLLDEHRDLLKPEVIWNIEEGLALRAHQIVKAENQRAIMFHRVFAFFESYDLLLCPATIVPPYPLEQRYVAECNGHTFNNYIEWLAIVYAITNVCCPAISVPAGFTKDHLPVGVQVVGRPRGETRLLAGAKLIQDTCNAVIRAPIDPRAGV